MMLWLSAFAQEAVSPARQCAEAATGTEIEVCLKLAAENPDSVNAISAALAAHVDRRSGPDRQLLQALLLLLDDSTGVEGTEALRSLDDPRAIAPLVHAARTRNEPIASAAVDALAGYPSGVAWLEAWLVDPERSLSVRLQAARALGRTPTAAAGDALIDSLRHRGLPPQLRQAMVTALELGHPHRKRELVRTISRDGTVWLTITGAAGLGYAMAVAGKVSEPEVAATGAAAGTIAGGTLGYLIGQAAPIEAGDAAFIATNTLVGTGAGIAFGAGALRGEPEIASWAGVAGEAAGLASGVALMKLHKGAPGDSIEAAAIGLAMGGIVGGALDLGVRNGLSDPDRSNTNPPLIGLGIGLVAGTAFGHLIAPEVKLQRNDWALILLSTGAGAALGALAPLSGNQRGTLPAMGAAAGSLSGFAIAGAIDPDLDALAAGTVGAALGGGALGGVVLWVRPEDRALTRGAILLGGIAGLGAGGLMADRDRDPIDDRDVVLSAYATGWVAGHVIALNVEGDGDPLRPLGPLLAIPCLTGGAVSALSSVLDIPVTHSSAAVSLGLVGATLGGTVGQLAADEPIWGGVIGGDVGLLTGIVVLSPLVNAAPTTLALANTGGVIGGGTGLALTRIFDRRTDSLLVGSVIGAGTGFIGGAVTGHVLRKTGATRNIALRAPRFENLELSLAPSVFPGVKGPAYGAVLQGHGW